MNVSGQVQVDANGLLSIGNVSFAAAEIILNGGTVVAAPGYSGNLSGHGIVVGDIFGAGIIVASGGSLTLGDINSPSGFDADGLLRVQDSMHVTLLDQDRAKLKSQSLTTLHNGARLAAPNGIDLEAGAVFNATGPALIQADFTNNGEVTGPFFNNEFLSFNDNVNGAGSFSGNIEFRQGFSPGNSPAVVSFNGDLKFQALSELQIEIEGLAAGTEHDQLAVSGRLSLGGVLHILPVDDYEPPAGFDTGNEFRIISSRNAVGQFHDVTYDGESLHVDFSDGSTYRSHHADGLFHTWSYDQDGVTFLSYRAAPGDADGDGLFDSADLVQVFQSGHYEDHVDDNSSWLDGDWNGDGDFDSSDLIAAFARGTYGGQSAEVVPEPVTNGLLLLFAAVSICAAQRRRISSRRWL